MGWSGSRTTSFETAVAKDQADTSSSRFRGINPTSPFYTQSKDTYSFNDTLNPLQRTPMGEKYIGQDKSSFWDNPLKDAEVHYADENAEAVDARSSRDPEDTVFARKDSEVRDYLVENKDPREGYVEGDPTMAQHQDKDLTEQAENTIVAGVDKNTWLSQPDVARMALENRGGLADELKRDPDLKENLETNPTTALRDDSREKVREELDDELSSTTKEVLDDEFMEDHPLAALKLLDDAGTREWVEQDKDYAEEFKRKVGTVEDEMRDQLADEAAEKMGSFPYNGYEGRFFEGRDDLAEAVWSDSLTSKGDDSVATWLNGQDINSDSTSSSDLSATYWADRAKQATGGGDSGIPEHLFDNNVSLSMMAARNENVAEGLTRDAAEIAVAYPDSDAGSLATKAYRAYGFGMGERSYGQFLRVA